MRDYLLDLVGHTHDLGCIDLIKITGTDKTTEVDGLAQDKSVILKAEFSTPIAEFTGVFGMPNLDKLKILLNIAEYREGADITVTQQDRNGTTVPVGLNFKNKAGDFRNDYRFMTAEIVAETLKTVRFKGASWNLEFEPTIAGIQRLKMQAQANSDIPVFKVRTDKNNLHFGFGDHSTHAGEFVFQPGVSGTLKHTWSWPVKQVIAILDLVGDKVMRITDEGAMQITVNSGVAVYNYYLPAQSK
jgi:hypothetical protein